MSSKDVITMPQGHSFPNPTTRIRCVLASCSWHCKGNSILYKQAPKINHAFQKTKTLRSLIADQCEVCTGPVRKRAHAGCVTQQNQAPASSTQSSPEDPFPVLLSKTIQTFACANTTHDPVSHEDTVCRRRRVLNSQHHNTLRLKLSIMDWRLACGVEPSSRCIGHPCAEQRA